MVKKPFKIHQFENLKFVEHSVTIDELKEAVDLNP